MIPAIEKIPPQDLWDAEDEMPMKKFARSGGNSREKRLEKELPSGPRGLSAPQMTTILRENLCSLEPERF
jgi:hypothetical protein